MSSCCCRLCCMLFFKQKTAYEMRISDWSSDVCSSDLKTLSEFHAETHAPDPTLAFTTFAWAPSDRDRLYAAIDKRFRSMMQAGLLDEEIGRASCRERVCQYG